MSDKNMKKSENLYKIIESILFDENNLDTLKNSINSLCKGILSPKMLREQIVDFRLNVVQKIVKLFSFYNKQLTTNTSLEEYISSPNSSQLKQELEEKNKFLEEIGSRVNNISQKLRYKLRLVT